MDLCKTFVGKWATHVTVFRFYPNSKAIKAATFAIYGKRK